MTDKRWPIEAALARAWVQAPTFEISSIQSSAIADRAIAALKEISDSEHCEECKSWRDREKCSVPYCPIGIARRALEMKDDE